MPVVSAGYKPPSIKERAFNCPHCGALAKQFWYSSFAQRLKDDAIPINFTPEDAEQFGQDKNLAIELRESLSEWAAKILKGLPFLESKEIHAYANELYNVSLSKCFNCSDISLWLSDRLVYPNVGDIAIPNNDIPDDAKFDYLEAASIVDLSPRGSAALLRLCIQKICVELGGTGKNINDDIAKLVGNGLDRRIQQALDVVRVIGNNAVHPGEIDLRDDRAVAVRLFELVNLIADVMISQPKHVAEMFSGLPEGARHAVERRDKV